MYAKRIQIVNYGPIERLDITFPFNGENPNPILLVGENGSGKSILLSHVVNGLMSGQGIVYPENSEMEKGRAYKMRGPSYIKSGREYSWGRVDFKNNLYCEEVQLHYLKKSFSEKPADFVDTSKSKLWDSIHDEDASVYGSNFHEPAQKQNINNIFNNNCILYFPHNRFEEAAWLNEKNLKSKAQYMSLEHIQGYTNRKIINYSSLHDNQNWLFEVLYDRYVFEMLTLPNPASIENQNDKPSHINPPFFIGYKGEATNIYGIVLAVSQQIFRADGNLRFGIGRRQNRKVSLIWKDKILVPNIFQLSSGETSLLNLFFSILRDFDLSKAAFNTAKDVCGIVIVDEIDLHLHTIHQYEVLPKLLKMFPRIQFIVTTHSPLFVLGMEKTFGRDNFSLYRLPQGQQISPEEFSEFGNAYQSFAETERFLKDIQKAIENAQKPIVFVDGITDVKYLQKAAELSGRKEMLEKIYIKDGGGFGNLNKIWTNVNKNLAEIIPQKLMLLHDCDKPSCENKGNLFKRNIPKQENHPLQKGIENLFDKETLERARKFKPAFIDVREEHTKTKRGLKTTVPEKWTINKDEKTNLCKWFCENGTESDFRHFQSVFDLLEKILTDKQEVVR